MPSLRTAWSKSPSIFAAGSSVRMMRRSSDSSLSCCWPSGLTTASPYSGAAAGTTLAGSPAPLDPLVLSPQPAATGTAASAAQTATIAPARGRMGARLGTADLRRGGEAKDRRAHAPDGTPPCPAMAGAAHTVARGVADLPSRAPRRPTVSGARHDGEFGPQVVPMWTSVGHRVQIGLLC